jgi:hypothetical protein
MEIAGSFTVCYFFYPVINYFPLRANTFVLAAQMAKLYVKELHITCVVAFGGNVLMK